VYGFKVRTRAAFRGFSLIELMVVVIIGGIISAVLLREASFYQETAEKAAMEATASAIRAALHLRMAHHFASGSSKDLSRLTEQNPMEWLATRPHNYAGELDRTAARDVAVGNWYFDPIERDLVYRIHHGGGFESVDGAKEVRYRAIIQYGDLNAGPDSMRGLALLEFAPRRPYKWQAQ
jgi:prepilin-type N-terminal cleavage/methylation domain-containing protein